MHDQCEAALFAALLGSGQEQPAPVCFITVEDGDAMWQ